MVVIESRAGGFSELLDCFTKILLIFLNSVLEGANIVYEQIIFHEHVKIGDTNYTMVYSVFVLIDPLTTEKEIAAYIETMKTCREKSFFEFNNDTPVKKSAIHRADGPVPRSLSFE